MLRTVRSSRISSLGKNDCLGRARCRLLFRRRDEPEMRIIRFHTFVRDMIFSPNRRGASMRESSAKAVCDTKVIDRRADRYTPGRCRAGAGLLGGGHAPAAL